MQEMSRLDALGDPALRRTLLHVRAQPRAVTAAEVAAALGIPRTAARWRLEKLAGAGLVRAHFERRTGRSGPGAGRPAKTYAAVPETAPLEFPRRRYETLVALLLRAIPRRTRAAHLRDVGVSFGEELARAARLRPAATVATALARLCRGLGRLGFQASVEHVEPGEAVIVSATCPLRPLVVADPAVSAIDQGMWQALVGASLQSGRAAGVVCHTHDCLDADAACRIVVTFGGRD